MSAEPVSPPREDAAPGVLPTHAVCPFCAVLCDDIRVEPAGAPQSAQLPILNGLCPRGQNGFRQAVEASDPRPRVRGEPVSAEVALAEAARLLAAAQSPIVAGLAAHAPAVRSALRLAEHCGASTDSLRFGGRLRNLRTLQEHGGVLTTFSELRNRADLVILVGGNTLRPWPRAAARLLPDGGLFLAPGERRIVRIGPAPDGAEDDGTPPAESLLECDWAELVDVIGLLQATLAAPKKQPAPLVLPAAVAALLQRIQAARYPVFLWDALAIDAAVADLLPMRLLQLVTRLNRTQRAAALAVGGNDGEVTSEQVHLWTTGFPSRTRLGVGAASYEPLLLDATRLLANRSADALLWLATLDPQHLPPADRHCATVVIGHPAMKPACEVFLPAAVPGVHTPAAPAVAGQMFRGDRIISLALAPVVQSSLVAAEQWLDALDRAVASRRTPRKEFSC